MPDVTNVSLPEVDCSCDCKKCVDREKRFYRMNATCTNCGGEFITKHRMGDQTSLGVACPHCGVSYRTVYGGRVSA